MSCVIKPKISTTFYENSPPQSVENSDIDLGPDFQKLLDPESNTKSSFYPPSPLSNIYLEVPSVKTSHPDSPTGSLSPYSPQSFATFPSPNSDNQSLYPSSPSDISSYSHSPNSYYSHSPSDGYQQYIKKEYYPNSPISNTYPSYVKKENYLSPCGSICSPTSPLSYSNLSSAPQHSDVLDLIGGAIIKQEAAIDFENILQSFHVNENITNILSNAPIVSEKPKIEDHQLLREVLRDTSFQKKYNIKPFDFTLMESQIKMEEPDDNDMMNPCGEQLPREKIDPVLNLAIEQMRKDVNNTCAALGISPDPAQWSSTNVLSWLQWTTNQFGLPAPVPDQWDLTGPNLMALSEEDFTRRAPQSGSILHAQLEIWKAAFSEEDLGTQWLMESTSSNASSGDMSDDDEEESTPEVDVSKPTTSRGTGSSHIHLWQFLKELLASPQTHGSCIRWIDRTKGIFKIEDSVKVARLWGKRKNRPAMNYDKLSRSIRQYYKKGIMKKTERSQRLVYQFCHPYNL